MLNTHFTISLNRPIRPGRADRVRTLGTSRTPTRRTDARRTPGKHRPIRPGAEPTECAPWEHREHQPGGRMPGGHPGSIDLSDQGQSRQSAHPGDIENTPARGAAHTPARRTPGSIPLSDQAQSRPGAHPGDIKDTSQADGCQGHTWKASRTHQPGAQLTHRPGGHLESISLLDQGQSQPGAHPGSIEDTSQADGCQGHTWKASAYQTRNRASQADTLESISLSDQAEPTECAQFAPMPGGHPGDIENTSQADGCQGHTWKHRPIRPGRADRVRTLGASRTPARRTDARRTPGKYRPIRPGTEPARGAPWGHREHQPGGRMPGAHLEASTYQTRHRASQADTLGASRTPTRRTDARRTPGKHRPIRPGTEPTECAPREHREHTSQADGCQGHTWKASTYQTRQSRQSAHPGDIEETSQAHRCQGHTWKHQPIRPGTEPTEGAPWGHREHRPGAQLTHQPGGHLEE